MRRLGSLAILVSSLASQHLSAEPAVETTASRSTTSLREVTAHAVAAVTLVPYCADLLWQVPSGGRLGWFTTSTANPDPLRANAQVFLLRGTGTLFSPGFGEPLHAAAPPGYGPRTSDRPAMAGFAGI